MKSGDWSAAYINWAYLQGAVAGVGNNNYEPDRAVTGVEAATMLARLLGYEVAGDNWELTARKIAIELGLGDGVASKDLFASDLTIGDMVVMVANTLNAKKVGAKITLAEEVFDLEIVEGAILLGADKLGSTDYSVFAFKDEIAGNVKYFIADLLSIEEKPTTDEIGQKYTLYVAKTEEVNGYKVLYAAYEEDANAYYKTVYGTVNDGKLNVNTDKANDGSLDELLDRFCVIYIDGVAGYTYADFAKAYGVKNYAEYKLIDNDGDGKYEYIFIERDTFAALGTKEVVANVVSYNASGAYTLSDGETYTFGQYWDVDKDNKVTSIIDASKAGVELIGKNGYTASNTQYKFYVVGEYIMKVEVCEDTYFAGDYVLSMGLADLDSYKGMPYVAFLNENNELIKTYVSKVDHKDAKQYDWLGHDLYYVVSNENDAVELFSAGYTNSHEAYKFVDDAADDANVKVTELTSFYSVLPVGAKYVMVAEDEAFDAKATYVRFVKDTEGKFYYTGNDSTKVFFDVEDTSETAYNDTTYRPIPVVTSKDTFNTESNGAIGYLAKLQSAAVAGTKVDVKVVATYELTAMQIYRAYGNWYFQQFGNNDADKIDIYFTKDGVDYLVKYNEAGKWDIVDAADKVIGEFQTGAADAAELNESLVDEIENVEDAYVLNAYDVANALNTSKGVIFAYGKYPYGGYAWRAYNLDEFDTDTYGIGGVLDDFAFNPYINDEVILANSNGALYVKAAKVSVAVNDTLPMGWRVANSDTFIVGKVDAGTWTKNTYTVQAVYPNGVIKYVTVPYGADDILEPGNIVYAVKDADGNYVSFEKIAHLGSVEFWADFDKTPDIYDEIVDLAKDGTMTFVKNWGVKVTEKLDLTKTFFIGKVVDANGDIVNSYAIDCGTFVDQFAAMKALVANGTIADADIKVVKSNTGYNFVTIEIAD
ncbi:MAG: S-layer homology domain-containing protein [Ruminococcaceae bacterium]|nr:S-layer homology domain-containing protein [Oscillospiraceae bacterium]